MPGAAPNQRWTDDQENVARQMAAEGKTPVEIGKALGKSRAAVIGFAYRQKIRVSTIAEHEAAEEVITEAASPAPPEEQLPPPEEPPQEPQGIPFHLLPWNGCRWIFGNRVGHDVLACGQKRVAGLSWCEEHARRVFIPRAVRGHSK
jgi:hypothetical protein